ncbi:MAG: hypothetical protein ACFFE4_06650 [Candidatus Thorarchaeota archaeon]
MTAKTKEKEQPHGYYKHDDLKIHKQQNLSPKFQIEHNPTEDLEENLTTMKKLHAILLNCINLTEKQKLEFAESERFFMKLHLQNILKKLKRD